MHYHLQLFAGCLLQADLVSDFFVKSFSEGINSIMALSQIHQTLCISVIGGTFFLLTSNSVEKPIGRKARIFFLLLIPAYLCLGISMFLSIRVAQLGVAAKFDLSHPNDQNFYNTMTSIVPMYNQQANFFYWGIAIIIFILLFYMKWWVWDANRR